MICLGSEHTADFTIQGLPPGRFESSLNTVWRRIYIHDEWVFGVVRIRP
jgi:hypothetical protein